MVPRHVRFGDELEWRLMRDHSWRSLQHRFLVRHPRLRRDSQLLRGDSQLLRGDSQLRRHSQLRRFSQPRRNAKLSTQLRRRDTRSRLLNS